MSHKWVIKGSHVRWRGLPVRGRPRRAACSLGTQQTRARAQRTPPGPPGTPPPEPRPPPSRAPPRTRGPRPARTWPPSARRRGAVRGAAPGTGGCWGWGWEIPGGGGERGEGRVEGRARSFCAGFLWLAEEVGPR